MHNEILVLTIALQMLLSFPENGDNLSLIVESTVYQNMNPAPYQRVGSKKHWNLSTKRRPQSGCFVPAFWQVKYSESVPYVFVWCFFLVGEHPNPLVYRILSSFPFTQGNHVSQLTLSPWRCKRCSSLSSAACLLAYGKMPPSSRNWIPQLRFA